MASAVQTVCTLTCGSALIMAAIIFIGVYLGIDDSAIMILLSVTGGCCFLSLAFVGAVEAGWCSFLGSAFMTEAQREREKQEMYEIMNRIAENNRGNDMNAAMDRIMEKNRGNMLNIDRI